MLYQLYTTAEGFVDVSVMDLIRRVRITQAGWPGLYGGQWLNIRNFHK